MTKLLVIITLTNGQSDYDLKFKLKDIDIAQRWLKHLNLFIEAGQPWDDAERFYNFPNTQFAKPVVVERLKKLIDTIKNYAPDIINRDIKDITGDDLNYLHHVFEKYHGLYDTQNTNNFFTNAPKEVQDALGNLNIWIHRYETLGGMPRFVATWKYKPYREEIQNQDFKLFKLKEQWGDLMLNYCEIGKTLFDFWHDNDQYVSAEAFKPLKHFCFDFTVRFTNHNDQEYQTMEQQIWQYFNQHKNFFEGLGYTAHDPQLSLGWISIGELVYNNKQQVIEQIAKHQKLKSISMHT